MNEDLSMSQQLENAALASNRAFPEWSQVQADVWELADHSVPQLPLHVVVMPSGEHFEVMWRQGEAKMQTAGLHIDADQAMEHAEQLYVEVLSTRWRAL